MRTVLIAAVIITAPLRALAQPPAIQPADQPARFNTEVLVTPERGDTPRSLAPAATVIDQATLAGLPIVHTGEITSFLPGFVVARGEYGGRPIVSSRGFFGGGEADYVLLLVDGIRVADVESGLVDWSIVPTASIRRVEASRGPAGSLYGDASLGGVIQILTDRQASGGRATLTGGSFGSVTADTTYGSRGPRAGFTVSGAARRTGGGFTHSAGSQVVGSGSADGGGGGYGWRWNATADTRDRDDPGAISTVQLAVAPYTSDPMFRFDTLNRRTFSTALTLRHSTRTWQPQARVYVATRDEELIRTIPLVPGFGDSRARALSSRALGGSIEGEHMFSVSRSPIVRFGIDLAHERLDTSYRSVTADGVIGMVDSEAAGRRLRAGAFVFSSWEPVSRLRVSGAVRWDAVDDSGFGVTSPGRRAWSPRAGVSLRLTDTGSYVLSAQVSSAFKAPTLDQLFDPRPFPDFRGGTFTISNPNLIPQHAKNVEAGISGGSRHVRWSALAYRMTVGDELDFDLRTFSYANIGRSRHTGMELEAEGRWSRVRPTIAYTLSRVVKLPDEEQRSNIPEHLVSGGAAVDLPWATSVHARYTRAWGAFLDDGNLYPLDGRSTIDLRARRSIGRHAIFVDVLNATGRVHGEYGFTLADVKGSVVPYVYRGGPRALRVGTTLAF